MKFNKVFKTLQNLSKVPVRPVDIAAALGVSRSNINYKRDKDVELTESDIEKLEKFFNISFSDLKKVPEEYQTAYKILNENDMPEDTIALDYYPDVFGSCGGGSFVFSEQNCRQKNEFIMAFLSGRAGGKSLPGAGLWRKLYDFVQI